MTTTWQLQLKRALNGNSAKALENHTDYSHSAAGLFKPVITDELVKAMQNHAESDALVKQFMPIKPENETHEGFSSDPVGDHDALAAQGIIHKYHGRVLVIASGSCAVNCRYCFRRHFPYQKQRGTQKNWQPLIDYLHHHPEVHEVILSGGDPLTLSTANLRRLSDRLTTLKTIKTMRIHSRIPTVLPDRVDPELLAWLKQLPLQKVLVTHINHSHELTPAAIAAIKRLREADLTLLNQSVLLKGVNDNAEILTELSHGLFKNAILPYYLHLFDRVQNAAHFEVDLKTAKRVYAELQRQLPGYLLPKMVQEIAGQQAKTPVF